MQVPERLALIGGSILLASTLVFTLKSQASSILPRIAHPISTIYDHAGDAQKASEFNNNFQQAQQKGWQTGNWGSSKYYIDDKNNMYVGAGQLQGSLSDTISEVARDHIQSLNFSDDVQAPQDSVRLLTTSHGQGDYRYSLTTINGLNNIDTSQVQDMTQMFYGEMSLDHLNLSSWDTSHVTKLFETFDDNESLNHINLSGWNTNNVQDMEWMFWHDKSLTDLDLSSFHTPALRNVSYIFGSNDNLQHLNLSNIDTKDADTGNIFLNQGASNLQSIQLGEQTLFKDSGYFPGNNWKNEQQVLSNNDLEDGQSHPGTWVRQ